MVERQVKGLRGIDKAEIEREIELGLAGGQSQRPVRLDLIVSLTSYPDRVSEVHFTLWSLLKQTIRPSRIVLWLGNDRFPGRERALPSSLLGLVELGIEIRWTEDRGPYTKLWPALEEFPDVAIVTADDDIYYHESWLERLVGSFDINPNAVHCHRAHRISLLENQIQLYATWIKEVATPGPSSLNFATGCGGVLYPPGCFYDRVLDHNTAQTLCPTADDVWFWAMTVLKKTRIVVVDRPLPSLVYVNPEREAGIEGGGTLGSINVLAGKNDIQIRAVTEAFPEILPILGFDSAQYWENRYAQLHTSGSGSYGRLSQFKARIVNGLLSEFDVESVVDFGFGDGNQIRLLDLPQYWGFDVSWSAVERARLHFRTDPRKTFYHVSEYADQQADLALSLDVVYHLVEDQVYIDYMVRLFASARKLVVIYSSSNDSYGDIHVRHRDVRRWVHDWVPEFSLVKTIENDFPFDPQNPEETSFANFYVFQRVSSRTDLDYFRYAFFKNQVSSASQLVSFGANGFRYNLLAVESGVELESRTYTQTGVTIAVEPAVGPNAIVYLDCIEAGSGLASLIHSFTTSRTLARVVVEFRGETVKELKELLGGVICPGGYELVAVDDGGHRVLRIRSWLDLETYVSIVGNYRGVLWYVPQLEAQFPLLVSHASGLGGAERSLLDLALGLAETGRFPTVLLPNHGPLEDLLREGSVGIVVSPRPFSWWATPKGVGLDIFAFRSTFEVVKDFGVELVGLLGSDVVFSQTIVTPWGSVLAELAALPHVVSAREYGDLDHDLVFPFGLKSSVSILLESSSRGVSITKSVGEHLWPAVETTRWVPSYCGVSVTPLPPPPKVPRQRKVALILASYVPGKGIACAIRAVHELKRKNIVLDLVVHGPRTNPAYLADLSNLVIELGIGDQVTLGGPLSDSIEAFAVADVLISAARSEGLGRTLLEAALHGIPIIYANSGGPAEIFESGKHGLSFTHDDAIGLAEALASVLEGGKATQQRVTVVQALVEQTYTRPKYVARNLAVLLGAVRNQDPRKSIVQWLRQSSSFDLLASQGVEAPSVLAGDIASLILQQGTDPSPTVFSQRAGMEGTRFYHRFLLPNNWKGGPLRYDPYERNWGRVRIDEVFIVYDGQRRRVEPSLLTHNGKAHGNGWIEFDHTDPSFTIPSSRNASTLEVSGEWSFVPPWQIDALKRTLAQDFRVANEDRRRLNMTLAETIGAYSSLYIDQGGGFFAKDREVAEVPHETTDFDLLFSTGQYKGMKELRFDPFENHWGRVKLERVTYELGDGKIVTLDLGKVRTNGVAGSDGWTEFETFDPMYFFPLDSDALLIVIEAHYDVFHSSRVERRFIVDQETLASNDQRIKQDSALLIALSEKAKNMGSALGAHATLMGFSADGSPVNSLQVEINWSDPEFALHFDLSEMKNVQVLRFHPFEYHWGHVWLHSVCFGSDDPNEVAVPVVALHSNGTTRTDGGTSFETTTPYFLLSMRDTSTWLHIVGRREVIPIENIESRLNDREMTIQRVEGALHETQHSLSERDRELTTIKKSRLWRWTKHVRRFMKTLKSIKD